MVNRYARERAKVYAQNKTNLVAKTSNVAVAFLSRNKVSAAEIPSVLQMIYSAFSEVAGSGTAAKIAASPTPAVPVRRSITPDYLISLEDGIKYKSLKRHLRTRYGMTPDEYRAKWGLPDDYPMVAPNYRAARSALAKKSGLGGRGRSSKKANAPASPA
jgi:predicted transcriptional regulator